MDSPLLRFKKTIIFFLTLLTLWSVGSFTYLTIPQVRERIDAVLYGGTPEQKANWSGLEGTILLTLRREPEEKNQLSIYQLELGRSDITPLATDAGTYFGPKVSRDGTLVAFSLFSEGQYRLRVTPTDFDGIEGNYSELMSGTTTVPQHPNWSFDGLRLAFVSGSGGVNAESNTVFVADPLVPGSARRVTEGSEPLFLRDGSLLVVKDDGLYRLVEDGLEWVSERVVSLANGSGTTNMQLAQSKDGTQLAWSNIEHETIDIYSIATEQERVRIEKTDELPGALFSPVFSPDGRYIAALAIESASAPLDQRLVAIELESGERAVLAKLLQYDIWTMSIGDWLEQ